MANTHKLLLLEEYLNFKAYAYDSVAGFSLRISFPKKYLIYYKITRNS